MLLVIAGGLRRTARELLPFWSKRFTTSQEYWRRRYAFGGNSGAGSRGENARYKADVVNRLITTLGIESVVDFGCGDGQNAVLLEVPNYQGVDISEHALNLARHRCRHERDWRFGTLAQADSADLALSMDVMFHLVEKDTYHRYLDRLAALGRRYCLVYSTDHDAPATNHVRHRAYSLEFQQRHPQWRLLDRIGERPEKHFCLFERIQS